MSLWQPFPEVIPAGVCTDNRVCNSLRSMCFCCRDALIVNQTLRSKSISKHLGCGPRAPLRQRDVVFDWRWYSTVNPNGALGCPNAPNK